MGQIADIVAAVGALQSFLANNTNLAKDSSVVNLASLLTQLYAAVAKDASLAPIAKDATVAALSSVLAKDTTVAALTNILAKDATVAALTSVLAKDTTVAALSPLKVVTAAPVSPAVNVLLVSTVIAPANPNRKGFYIWNNSANSAYVSLAATSTSAGPTQIVPTFQTWSMVGPLCYQGPIAAIRNSGSGTMTVWELT